MIVLLAEELVLLCLDPTTGRRTVSKAVLEPGLAGALIAELVLAERVGTDAESQGRWRASRITLLSGRPIDDVELDRALTAVVKDEGRKVKDLVSRMSRRRLSKGLRDRLLARLAAATILVEQHDYALGVFPRTVWTVRDPARVAPVRRRLTAALMGLDAPAERTTALIGLLHAMGQIHRVLPEADRRAVRRRAAELSAGDWVARAVKQAIRDEFAAASGSG